MMNTSYFIIVINFGLIIKSETERIIMSTNYYVKTGKFENVICNYGCEHIIEEKLHIGLFSFGWKFCLHIIPEKNINELNDWKPILKNGKIEDEYGREISYDEMLNKILKATEDINAVMKNNCSHIPNECLFDVRDDAFYCKKNKIGSESISYVLVEGEFS